MKVGVLFALNSWNQWFLKVKMIHIAKDASFHRLSLFLGKLSQLTWLFVWIGQAQIDSKVAL